MVLVLASSLNKHPATKNLLTAGLWVPEPPADHLSCSLLILESLKPPSCCPALYPLPNKQLWSLSAANRDGRTIRRTMIRVWLVQLIASRMEEERAGSRRRSG